MSSYLDRKLEVIQLKKSFGNVAVLKNITMHLSEGEFVSLVGLSGCGKTTIFNIVSGLDNPDSGSVIIDGKDYTHITGRVSYMQQKDLLLPWKKVIDNVALPLYLKGVKKQEAQAIASEYFELFGLKGFEKAYPFQLSGGMRQRAALLRTYLFSKDIILLDEPFGALDAINRDKLQLWLKEILKKLGVSVLLITHDIDEAINLSDRLYVLSEKPSEIIAEVDCRGAEPAFLKEKVISLLLKRV